MDFKTPSQQAIYERLVPLMKDLFGEMSKARDDRPTFGIRMGYDEAGVFNNVFNIDGQGTANCIGIWLLNGAFAMLDSNTADLECLGASGEWGLFLPGERATATEGGALSWY